MDCSQVIYETTQFYHVRIMSLHVTILWTVFGIVFGWTEIPVNLNIYVYGLIFSNNPINLAL